MPPVDARRGLDQTQQVEPTLGLEADDLHEVFTTADAASLDGQKRFIRGTGFELVLVVLAAVLASIDVFEGRPTDWFRLAAALVFFATAIIKINLLSSRPHSDWHEGRAAAESAKTLAWRYAVGGDPFGVQRHSSDASADRLFRERLSETLDSLGGTVLLPDVDRPHQITPKMRTLRAQPLEIRKEAYLVSRLDDQRRWYANKSRWNRDRARRWNFAMLIFQVVGAAGALLEATGDVPYFEFEGVAAAAVGAIAAWSQTKQHQQLADMYAIAARELTEIRVLAEDPRTEDEWATFIAEAEEAVSREHTLWQAARGGKDPSDRVGGLE